MRNPTRTRPTATAWWPVLGLAGWLGLACCSPVFPGVPRPQESAETKQPLAPASPSESTQESETSPVAATEQDSSKHILRDISFDDLKFDIPIGTPFKRELLSDDVEKFEGQLIKIRGYMKPNFQQSNIEKFVLVRDNQACCFGPGAAIYDCVLVMLEAGKKTEFSVRPITVRGTMYLKEYKGPDGNIWAIFRMKNAAVE